MNETRERVLAKSSKKWRNDAVKLLMFLVVLAIEAAFNVGVLLGRWRWKNDLSWVGPVFVVMCVTLAVLLWALYHQARRVTMEYIAAADE